MFRMQSQVLQMQSMHHQNQNCCDDGGDAVVAVLDENVQHVPLEPVDDGDWRDVPVLAFCDSPPEQDDCCYVVLVVGGLTVLPSPLLLKMPRIARRLMFFSCITPLSVILLFQKQNNYASK